ncbi:MAG: hypothetical protein EXQ86_08785 [Rhodospirillales bacterium]|nr:hypothetical protein [Rhodospirillales bacterium]
MIGALARSTEQERGRLATWDQLIGELASWQSLGRVATFWWRDDDAVEATPELETMIEMSEMTKTSIGLAAIPGSLHPSLREYLARRRTAFVLQHGFMHRNHASASSKKSEFGPGRALAVMRSELAEGWRRISTFDRALPVFVPPWNRCDSEFLAILPEAGFKGFSTYCARKSAAPAPGIEQNNTHMDIVNWRARTFVGEQAALTLAVEHLAARREGRVDPDEATGLLTHHRVHDGACWAFVRRFLDETHRHPAAQWMSPRALFPA